MRGLDHQQSAMFSYLSPEQRVPSDHPLRAIREITDIVLKQLSLAFSQMYSNIGRRSIPPEKLLRALILQVLYTVRSERLLTQVRHETGQNWAKPFRISLGSRQVYTTFGAFFEAVWKAQLELMKQGFLLGRGFRDTAQSNLTAVRVGRTMSALCNVDSSASASIGDNGWAFSTPLADGFVTVAARRLRRCLRVTQSA